MRRRVDKGIRSTLRSLTHTRLHSFFDAGAPLDHARITSLLARGRGDMDLTFHRCPCRRGDVARKDRPRSRRTTRRTDLRSVESYTRTSLTARKGEPWRQTQSLLLPPAPGHRPRSLSCTWPPQPEAGRTPVQCLPCTCRWLHRAQAWRPKTESAQKSRREPVRIAARRPGGVARRSPPRRRRILSGNPSAAPMDTGTARADPCTARSSGTRAIRRRFRKSSAPDLPGNPRQTVEAGEPRLSPP